jgi:hypothetical protein
MLLACSREQPSRFESLFSEATAQHHQAMEELIQAGKDMAASLEDDRKLIELSKRKPLTPEIRERMNAIMANGRAVSQRATEAGVNALESTVNVFALVSSALRACNYEEEAKQVATSVSSLHWPYIETTNMELRYWKRVWQFDEQFDAMDAATECRALSVNRESIDMLIASLVEKLKKNKLR